MNIQEQNIKKNKKPETKIENQQDAITLYNLALVNGGLRGWTDNKGKSASVDPRIR